MNILLTIFRKELVDTIRDRRTLFMMIIFPLFLVPVMMLLATKLQTSQMKKAEEKIIRIGIVTNNNATDFSEELRQRKDLRIIEGINPNSATALIQSDSLEAVIILAPDFDKRVSCLEAGDLQLYFKSSDDFNIVKKRIMKLIDGYETRLLEKRLKKLQLSTSITTTLRVHEHDIATMQEKIGMVIGGFLPYIFVIFCFMGSMYPAIDLAAGEKERGTIETLLTVPATKFQILLGKFAVVVLVGLSSAAISIIGLYITVKQIHEIPQEVMDVIMGILGVKTILLVFSLLFPLAMFMAAFLLSLSIFAKSFKEAQSLISPLTIIIIIPVFIALIPGINLNYITALIPILNVSLTTKSIISGTITFGILCEVYVSLIILAAVSLYLCSKWFEREEIIFRGS